MKVFCVAPQCLNNPGASSGENGLRSREHNWMFLRHFSARLATLISSCEKRLPSRSTYQRVVYRSVMIHHISSVTIYAGVFPWRKENINQFSRCNNIYIAILVYCTFRSYNIYSYCNGINNKTLKCLYHIFFHVITSTSFICRIFDRTKRKSNFINFLAQNLYLIFQTAYAALYTPSVGGRWENRGANKHTHSHTHTYINTYNHIYIRSYTYIYYHRRK